MSRSMRLLRCLSLACLPLLGACQSQWFMQHDQGEIVTTNVLVETTPANGYVSFNGVRQAKSPVRIPVEYDHTEQLWSRQTNAGADMRDGMSPLVQVLTFPVWGIASLFHRTEDSRRHVYGGNRHVASATLRGHYEASQSLVLEGQLEIRVELTLTPLQSKP